MIKRAGILACAVLIVTGTVAGAATLRGRGSRTQGAMDAHLLGPGTDPVQVLNQLCTQPLTIADCTPISGALRREIEGALGRPVTWVDRQPSDAFFVVFAPVLFGKSTAAAEYAWWMPNASLCRGDGQDNYERDHGAWQWVSGFGLAHLCP